MIDQNLQISDYIKSQDPHCIQSKNHNSLSLGDNRDGIYYNFCTRCKSSSDVRNTNSLFCPMSSKHYGSDVAERQGIGAKLT